MSAHAAPAPGGRTLSIRGTAYPVVLPKLSDPRLHLAAVIITLQVLGQVEFHFRVSIAQILLSLLTCALLEVAIAVRKQHVLMWPASAMLTGNGVAFILRVPGTQHGDWWSLRGWWIFVGTAAISLLSKYVIKWRGGHVFNPSNFGLVLCFLVLGRNRAEPLDFWWGGMSPWLGLAFVVIVSGGLVILSRLRLLWIAVAFWLSFAAGIGVLAASGHAMTARWHLGPIVGWNFWWVLLSSPEVLVFLFFMLTDPKTSPKAQRQRVVYAVSVGLLAALLIAPLTTEWATKVALLTALAIVCAARPLLAVRGVARLRVSGLRLALVAGVATAAYATGLVVMSSGLPASTDTTVSGSVLPPITVLPSRGVQTQLDVPTARAITRDLLGDLNTNGDPRDHVKVWLEPGAGQDPPFAVAQLSRAGQRAAVTYRLHMAENGQWALGSTPDGGTVKLATAPPSTALSGTKLTNVAAAVGLDFKQGSFRYGVTNDYTAMMGGGVCWLDYNNDGWQDLFVVNSYSDADLTQWQAHGGVPRTALFANEHGRFHNVSAASHANLAVQGDGCAAADLNGDGYPDLVVSTTHGADILWNNRDGTFTKAPLTTGLEDSYWYTGVAIADVNGDTRPDIVLAGYTDLSDPVPNSIAGFPTSFAGVRDLLFRNDGQSRFREVGVQAGLEAARFSHGLGAVFLDYNGDGRPDLYVANDEDPNQLYENVPWPGGAKADPAGLGFRFEERAVPEGVADQYAGMGIAAAGYDGDGRMDLLVTNSRREPSAVFRGKTGPGSPAFANARPAVDPALGTGFAGWGASWVDLANSGSPDLVVAAGAIPVTKLAQDAEPLRVLAPRSGKAATVTFGNAAGVLPAAGIRLNGRGLAVADAGNDGRMDIAVNTIGGRLVLLRSSGPIGHWLEVATSPLTPGATVTAVLPNGKRLVREVQSGSSYLSSEDPRLHFGLGRATALTELIVRFPFGGTRVLRNVHADRVVVVKRPASPAKRQPAASPMLASCTRPNLHGQSIAEVWDATARAVLGAGNAAPPVAARDLFHLSAAMWDAWAAYDPTADGYFVTTKTQAADPLSARETAISYAAYRLLLSRASVGANLDRSFGLLTSRLRSLCLSPDFTSTTGSSPAALGNRIAAAAIAYGNHDGSLEELHYTDPSYVPQNAPLQVSRPGSTVHDATFWQPLALGQKAAQGFAPVPADVQTFVGAQWGHVHGFALPPSAKGAPLDPGPPPLGLPSSASYQQAAIDVIRATAGRIPPVTASTPSGWNAVVGRLPRRGSAAARLEHDVKVYFSLDAALHDAAIVAWGAKRTYQSPRPISMIRYLAFQGQSSDPKGPSYNAEGIRLVPGLVELVTKASSASGQPLESLAKDVGQVAVLRNGRWVLGTRWTPTAPTPPSPGWVSSQSAFAFAAAAVLDRSTGRSYDAAAAQAGRAGVATGIDIPADDSAGRALGTEIGKRAWSLAQRYFSGTALR
jgi:Na+-translocating ferredoxin:NAD+ oxidoreductase RnfD subunit